MTTNFGKLDKFEGHDFRRWQKKMHFLLTTLKVFYVLTTPMPELVKDATVEAIRIRAKWENDDYICRGHILNGMSDSLFDVYTNVESAEIPCSHLRIKESLRAQDGDKEKGKEVGGPSVNMIEEGKNKQNKVVKRITQMLVVRERGLRTNLNTKVDAIAWWIDSGATTHVCKDRWIVVVVKRTTQMLVVREKDLRTNPKTKVDAIAWWIDFGATTHVGL
nr:retrovirus-related Pol polyprotein from transposon TNT 1-94 [Tanacetum cinerariifolium]